jgi:omega-6 fatty acid desaturase (delta-12 desaturase)
MSISTTVFPRPGRQLFEATLPFAEESSPRSWWNVVSTLAVLFALLVGAAVIPWWPLRLTVSITGGLVMVRTFILYHDYMHGALLSESRLAQVVFHTIGVLMLAPPRHWRFSHNFHHSHVGKVEVASENALLTSDVGSFPLMSTQAWRTTTFWQRFSYRISRHPLTILSAYVTIFLLSMCITPLRNEPHKNWDGAVSILAHFGMIAVLWLWLGFGVALFAFILPYTIASALGAYLFYAQHTYEGLRILPAEKWSYFDAALESSSYLKMGRIMSWFTGNIGYHHIHHLNPQIPFYRLPEVMAALPELQNPAITTLRPRDIVACFRANLWETSTQQMVSYREAPGLPAVTSRLKTL